MTPKLGRGHNKESKFNKKYIEQIFENLLLKNHLARKAETYLEASLGSVDIKLLKAWPPGVGRGHNRESKFYIEIYRTNL